MRCRTYILKKSQAKPSHTTCNNTERCECSLITTCSSEHQSLHSSLCWTTAAFLEVPPAASLAFLFLQPSPHAITQMAINHDHRWQWILMKSATWIWQHGSCKLPGRYILNSSQILTEQQSSVTPTGRASPIAGLVCKASHVASPIAGNAPRCEVVLDHSLGCAVLGIARSPAYELQSKRVSGPLSTA